MRARDRPHRMIRQSTDPIPLCPTSRPDKCPHLYLGAYIRGCVWSPGGAHRQRLLCLHTHVKYMTTAVAAADLPNWVPKTRRRKRKSRKRTPGSERPEFRCSIGRRRSQSSYVRLGKLRSTAGAVISNVGAGSKHSSVLDPDPNQAFVTAVLATTSPNFRQLPVVQQCSQCSGKFYYCKPVVQEIRCWTASAAVEDG